MKPYQDKDKLTELYNKHKSAYKIADELGVNHKTIYAWLKKFKIETNGSQGARKHRYNQDFFEVIDTEEKAYWLGFIMADGCIYHSSDKFSYRLQINLKASDVEHLSKFQEAIGSSYKIQVKKVKNSKAEAALLKINSTKMCKDLIKHNVVPRKSLVCEMPTLPEHLIRHFIRGYFDGDGSIGIYEREGRRTQKMTIVGGKPMLESIVEYLQENEIKSYLYPHRNVWYLEVRKRSDVVKFAHYLYDGASIYLERKFNTSQKLFELCPLAE